jgi:hypothetical protein
MLHPEAADEHGRRRAANVARTEVDVIAAANPGCAIQIARYLERPITIVHPIELLARSLKLVRPELRLPGRARRGTIAAREIPTTGGRKWGSR